MNTIFQTTRQTGRQAPRLFPSYSCNNAITCRGEQWSIEGLRTQDRGSRTSRAGQDTPVTPGCRGKCCDVTQTMIIGVQSREVGRLLGEIELTSPKL